MTDSEILRAVGISTYLYENPSNSLCSMIVKAMAQARADERGRCAKIINDRAKKCAEAADQSDNERFNIAMLTLASDFNVIEQEILDGKTD